CALLARVRRRYTVSSPGASAGANSPLAASVRDSILPKPLNRSSLQLAPFRMLAYSLELSPSEAGVAASDFHVPRYVHHAQTTLSAVRSSRTLVVGHPRRCRRAGDGDAGAHARSHSR